MFARSGGLEVVNLISGKVEHTVGYPVALSWPELSPDGRRLSALSASAEEEKLIVWDLATGDRILDLPISVSGLKDVCFSPDGRHLAIASVSTEGSKIVDLDTGRSRWFIQPGGMSAWSIAFSPESDRLVTAMGWQTAGHLRVFSLSGERLALHLLPRDEYDALAFSPDGRLLAVGQKERTIRVFDAATLEELHVLHGHKGAVTALAFLPDGERLASGSADGTIRLWNLETGSVERVITGLPPGWPLTSLASTPDGAMLAAGGVSGTRLWALERGARVTIEAHDTYVYGVAFSPDGQTIVSAPFTGNVHLFNALDGTKLAELPSEMPFRLLAYTPDGARLLIHNADLDKKAPTLFAWDPAAGVRLTTPRRESDRVFFRHREDARDAGLASFLAVRGGTRSAPMSVYSVALSADRSLVAYASGTYNSHASEDEILILNTATGETISRFGKQMGKIYSIALSSDAMRVVSGDGNGTLNVWDLATGTLLATMTEHTGVVLSIVYSPDGSRIASGGNDGSIILWNAETFENVLILRGHRSYVHSVSFSDDGTMIASASGDGTVRIWDSVRPAERWRQSQRANALRLEAELLVDRLISRLTDPLDVADEIRGDTTLDDKLRRAALLVLLQRSPVAVGPRP